MCCGFDSSCHVSTVTDVQSQVEQGWVVASLNVQDTAASQGNTELPATIASVSTTLIFLDSQHGWERGGHGSKAEHQRWCVHPQVLFLAPPI